MFSTNNFRSLATRSRRRSGIVNRFDAAWIHGLVSKPTTIPVSA